MAKKRKCMKCGTALGQYHGFWCTCEQCPFCFGQLAQCECFRGKISTPVEDEISTLTSEQEREWKKILQEKGRIVYGAEVWDTSRIFANPQFTRCTKKNEGIFRLFAPSFGMAISEKLDEQHAQMLLRMLLIRQAIANATVDWDLKTAIGNLEQVPGFYESSTLRLLPKTKRTPVLEANPEFHLWDLPSAVAAKKKAVVRARQEQRYANVKQILKAILERWDDLEKLLDPTC